MTNTARDLLSETKLTTTATTLVTTDSTNKKLLGKITLTNTSTQDVVVTLWRLKNATSPTEGEGGNYIWENTVLAKDQITVTLTTTHLLDNKMKLVGKASVDGVVNIDISGIIIT